MENLFHTNVNILLVHSQDHLMTSMLAQELIKELIYLHETKADKKRLLLKLQNQLTHSYSFLPYKLLFI